ncbi:MAG: LPS export ABC transporter periplasmic protein LptC [Alphaproteobacteria bacterium]
MDQNQVNTSQNEDRLARLAARSSAPATVNQGYTTFVRVMRLALPVVAVGIIALLYSRTGEQESAIVPVEEYTQEIEEQQISRNELLNPKFESVDKKDQPYLITADRAIQGEMNKELIMLERPIGTMTMSDGVQVRMHSDTGAYRQDTERFFLQGNVHLEHAQGYKIFSEEAHIDLKKNFAWSEKDVRGEGPDLFIEGSGVHANGKTGEIVFTGPAKLILDDGFEGIK